MAACSGDGGDAAEDDVDAAPGLGDHVHLAYGVYVCDGYVGPLSDQRGDRYGIHTHEDGLIHVHATAEEATGTGAVLGLFAEEVGLGLDEGSLTLPDGTRYEDGDDCEAGAGTVRVLTWDDPDDPSPEVHEDGMDEIPVRRDGGVLAIVFAADDAEVPQPPWAVNLQDPTAAEEGRPPATV